MATNNTPEYYKDDNGMDLLDKWMKTGQKDKFFGFVIGNIEKYIERFDGKNGLEDLEKARDYIDRLIEGVKYFNNDVSDKFSSVKIPAGLDFKEANLDDLLEKQQKGFQNMKDVNVCEGYIDKLWDNDKDDISNHVGIPFDDDKDFLQTSAEMDLIDILTECIVDIYGFSREDVMYTIHMMSNEDIETMLSPKHPSDIDKLVKKYDRIYGVNTDLIRAIAEDYDKIGE